MTRYKLIDNGCVGYTINGTEFYFDQNDTEKVIAHEWFIDEKGFVTLADERHPNVHLHEYLMYETDPMNVVYHVDGDKLNNRKVNLKRKRPTKLDSLNQFQVDGDCVTGFTTKGEEFYFDKGDLQFVTQHTWRIDKYGYVIASIRNRDGKSKKLRLHRCLMGVSDPSVFVDHIDGNPVNNKKSNLRCVSPEQNAQNHKISSANTTGFNGVYWNKRNKKWSAMICVKHKLKYLGYFNTMEDAIQARKSAEEKYYGDYVRKP